MTINYLDSKRISMTSNVTFEQASNNDSRTFGVGGRTALGVKLSAGHSLVGATVRTFSVIVNQDPSGAGDIKAYVIRSGYGSNDQVAESTASTLPTGNGNTTFNITFTFSSDVSILANDIIAFTNVGMTSVSSAKTSSSDIDPNAEALCVVSGTAFTFSDFVTLSGTYNNLAYKTTSTAKPTNVQDNSILVEKDTGRRYWLEPEVPSTSASTATTENDNGVNEQVMSSVNFEFIGEKVVNSSSALYGLTVNKIGFMMNKFQGSPTGTATACVMDSSANILYTFGTVDVSTLPSTYTWTYFTNTSSTYTLTNGNYIGIKYSGGDASNRIGIYWDNAGSYDGTDSQGSEESGGAWNDRSGQDLRFKIFTGTAFNTCYLDYATNMER